MAKSMPLGFLDVGKEAIVLSIQGGTGLSRKLSEMGFAQGIKVKNVKNDGAGPLIVAVMDCRIAIGRGMAQKILIEESA
ncbi:ferrous iron transport protein A [Desulfonispora thiosulfatigenes DSM 11270]|uniref:Ferrous iron transport protein A n=1 Tax=Desulfonispora thiosulfatigenes DSM 11270 TaxID=656914 RepID=A0A1W1VTY5_DESTI|nr:FeoA family protein [Desulfonispora thiosulfatigenes]SMB96571.1 ferrous iron transport protein A [Desulfonispora thiosulfatigenes DSM 11270]